MQRDLIFLPEQGFRVVDDSRGLLRKSDSVLMNKAQCVYVWVGCVRLHWVGFPSSLSHPKISRSFTAVPRKITTNMRSHNFTFYVLQLLQLSVFSPHNSFFVTFWCRCCQKQLDGFTVECFSRSMWSRVLSVAVCRRIIINPSTGCKPPLVIY